jgi:hypothetical protein
LFDSFFGGIGSIITDPKTNMYEYRVQGFKNCLKVKEHFISYPLISYRLVIFDLWCEMLNIIEKKAHLTNEGLTQLLRIKAAFPKGLTNKIKIAFPKTIAVNLPEYRPILSNLNYFWIAGFINTDGSFFFNTRCYRNN